MGVLWLAISLGHAGPWTRDLGSFYVQGGADVYVPAEYVQRGRPARATDDRFTGTLYSLYGEVGVSPAHPVQVVFSLPFARYRVDFEREDAFRTAVGSVTTNRLQDLRVMPQVALHPDAPLAVGLEVKQPLYRNGEICSDYAVFGDVCAVPGDGQTDITPWVLAGATAGAAPFWAELGLGYLHRTERFVGWDPDLAFVDGFTWQSNLGVDLGGSLWMLKSRGVKNLARDRVTNEFAAIAPGVLFTFWDHLGLDIHVSWEVWANNQSRGVTYGAGVSWFN